MLALYDILNGLGYKVFLDQYVLTAAAPLAVSLEEALDASQSAILIWSENMRIPSGARRSSASSRKCRIQKGGSGTSSSV